MLNIEGLPLFPHLQSILNVYMENDVIIVSTPTSSGKTVLLPATLHEIFKKKVILTSPRVLLAKSTRNLVANMVIGNDHAVGLQTGKGDLWPNANILVTTEGSFCNRGFKLLNKDTILVVDEAHEQNIDTEEVLYLGLQAAKKGTKLVIMSATIDVTNYVNYFKNNGLTVGIYEMPEPKRSYETQTIIVEDPITEVVKIDGKVLIGVDGKDAIEKTIEQLMTQKYTGKIFQLHSEIEEWEEEEALSYDGGACVYIATSVAMSGITFPNLQAVVVPHYGKRMENGELVRYPLSVAEQKQWAGRVGRTNDGLVIHSTYSAEYKNRDVNVRPKILLESIENTVLSFLRKGYDLEKIELLNQPPNHMILQAKQYLVDNQIITIENTLTEIGEYICDFGKGISTGLFAYYGEKLGIFATALKIATLITEGTPYRKAKNNNNPYKFLQDIKKKNELFNMSDHMAIIHTIETDYDAHMGKGAIVPMVKKYAEENGIFIKGVKKLLKEFTYIDKQYYDEVELNKDLIKELFASQPKREIFEYGYNSHIDNIVRGRSGGTPILGKCYANVAPITIRGGRLVEMVTSLN